MECRVGPLSGRVSVPSGRVVMMVALVIDCLLERYEERKDGRDELHR